MRFASLRAGLRQSGTVFFSTFVRGLTPTAKTNVALRAPTARTDVALRGSGARDVSKEKTPSNLRRGRIVEGVAIQLSGTFSNVPRVCVGDAGHGQVFSAKWPSGGVRFGSDRARPHICQRQM